MFVAKLLPFAGLALAAVDGEDGSMLNNSTTLYGLTTEDISNSLSNANATDQSGQKFYGRNPKNETDQWGWLGSVRLEVAANVPVPKGDGVDDNQVVQLTGFRVALDDENKERAKSYPSTTCITVVQGLNDKLTEAARTSNSCSGAPPSCLDKLSNLMFKHTDPSGCTGSFTLPAECEEAFPGGKVTTMTLRSDDLDDGGYFFAHASPPAERGSKSATDAYAQAAKAYWPVFVTSVQKMIIKGNGRANGTSSYSSPNCLQVSRFAPGSEDPNKAQDPPKDDPKDDGKNGGDSGVGRIGSASTSVLVLAIAMAVLLV